MNCTSKSSRPPCPDDQNIVEVFRMAAEESQKARIAILLFGLGERDKAKDNPGLAASLEALAAN